MLATFIAKQQQRNSAETSSTSTCDWDMEHPKRKPRLDAYPCSIPDRAIARSINVTELYRSPVGSMQKYWRLLFPA
jgi:hypothetical protein